MSWGDTFGLGLGVKSDKHLIVWTPKETSEGDILPGFDSEDGELTLKNATAARGMGLLD